MYSFITTACNNRYYKYSLRKAVLKIVCVLRISINTYIFLHLHKFLCCDENGAVAFVFAIFENKLNQKKYIEINIYRM